MDELRSLLGKASSEQLESLRKILDTVCCTAPTPDEVIKGLKWLHRNIFEDFYRDVFGEQESYKDILRSICKRLKIDFEPFHSTEDLETSICQEVVKTVWEKLNEKQRSELMRELDKIAEKQGKGADWGKAGGLAGAIVAAELGGFATYVLATSGLAALGGLAGVTFPFAAYTGLSTALGVVLGPVGWVGVGLYALMKISGPNFKKLIPAILFIAALRYELDQD